MASQTTSLAKIRALVVDDEPGMRNLLRLNLEQQDLTVLEAQDAKQALRRIRRDRPDLVLLDLGLPDRDGLDVLEDVRLESSVPIVVPARVTRNSSLLDSRAKPKSVSLTKVRSPWRVTRKFEGLMSR